jgi:hypothetical protein
MSSSKLQRNSVLVHRRKSGKVEVRYADEFTRRPRTPKTPSPPHLHFRRSDHSQVCRCSDSKRHKSSSPVTIYSKHLEADLLRYLDRQCVDACFLYDFRAYQKQQRDDWTRAGICIGDFHYATNQKDVVCRCTKSNNHGHGAVRNTEIMELCAEFFRVNKGKMTCTKAQWREAPILPQKDNPTNFRGRRGARGEKLRISDAFKSDSQSTVDLLRAIANIALRDPLPSPKTDMTHLRSGQDDEPDIPEQVWIKARPSVYNDGRGSETSISTPIGIIPPPLHTVVALAPAVRSPRPESLGDRRRPSVATVWSTVQREAAGEELNVTVEYEQHQTSSRADSFVETFGISIPREGTDDGPGRLRRSSQHSLSPATSSVYSRSPGVMPRPSEIHLPLLTPAHELPADRFSNEMPTSLLEAELHGHSTPELDSHAFNLRELEGNPPKPLSNWQGE